MSFAGIPSISTLLNSELPPRTKTEVVPPRWPVWTTCIPGTPRRLLDTVNASRASKDGWQLGSPRSPPGNWEPLVRLRRRRFAVAESQFGRPPRDSNSCLMKQIPGSFLGSQIRWLRPRRSTVLEPDRKTQTGPPCWSALCRFSFLPEAGSPWHPGPRRPEDQVPSHLGFLAVRLRPDGKR